MGNHDHLLIETPSGNASRALQWLNVSYAVWHNVRHQETGSLFQARFKSIPVEGQGAWALVGCQYIHLNPVRVVTKLQKRPWDDFTNQRGDWGRDLALLLGRTRSGMTLHELGRQTGMNVHAVSKAVTRLDLRLKRDVKLQRIKRHALRMLEGTGVKT